MQNLLDLSLDELALISQDLGLPSYKAKEIFKFAHKLLKNDINAITPLSNAERTKLSANYDLSSLKPTKVLQEPKVTKVAFAQGTDAIFEAVQMEYEKRRKTVCVSSQVGCSVGCKFCATGGMGFKRNLTVAEILTQIYYFAAQGPVSNIVFMGMGEPFLNYTNVLKAAKILNHPLGQNIGARKITISTIGVVPGIKKLMAEKEQFRLAWSLVAPDDGKRRKLVPLERLPSINECLRALGSYQKKTKRRITIEYVVLAGENDSAEDASELIKIARQLDCHINLIPYNSCPGLRFKSGDIKALAQELEQARVNVTVRRSLGQKIGAACGQLAGKPN